MTSVQSSSAPGKCSRCQALLSNATADGMCTRCLLTGALASLSDDEGMGNEQNFTGTLLCERQIGGYHLLGEIGRGGMGVVFKARQIHPERLVAIKVIAAGELASPVVVKRFQNKALAVARLEHPNIVPIYEVGDDRGWHFFSMQLIEGCTLAVHIRDTRPSPLAAAGLLAKIARAVDYAHRRGVLHRDLKPNNILMDEAGEPHLTDFGLAKLIEQDSDLTLSHALLGTPAYMSPEQATGSNRDLTTATDVYGLGAIFYEMLSGRPPFTAASTPALLRLIAEEEPALPRPLVGTANPSPFSPPELDLEIICLKCLKKESADRYSTAGELADDLERWLRHEPILARPSGTWERSFKWIRRHRALAALFASLGLSGLVLTAVSLAFNIRLDRARNAAEKNAVRRHEQLVREHQRKSGRATAAGDGLIGLFALTEALRLEQGNPTAEAALRRRLGLTLRSSPELLRLWDAEGAAVHLQFTPDNRFLAAIMRDGSTRHWDLVSGATSSSMATEKSVLIASILSPDGLGVLESLRVVPFARFRKSHNTPPIDLPLPSACDRAIAFGETGRLAATGGDRLRLWRVDSWDEIPLRNNGSISCARIVFSPHDRRLLSVAVDGKLRVLNLESLAWTEVESVVIPPDMPSPSFSGDGHWLLVSTQKEVVLLEAETGRRAFAAPHSGLVFETAFSPDGRFFRLLLFENKRASGHCRSFKERPTWRRFGFP